MNIKKTKLSWLFFAIYIITYLYLGVCIGNTMSKMLNLGKTAISCIVVVMVILLAFVGCAAALIVLMKAKPKNEKASARRKRRALRNDGFFAKELLPALASYLLVVVSRGIYIVRFSDGKLTGNVGLYEQISSGAGVEFDLFRGVERLYAYLLKGFCILLGNVPDAVYMLNLICQVILVFCCYLFLRIAVGKAAAVSSSVLFLGIPYFYRALIACEPSQLFMALCMAGVCVLAFVVRRSVFDLGGKGMYPAYLFCGLVSGILLALDLTALLIPLTVIVFFLLSVQGRRAELVCFALGVLVGFPAGMVLLNVDVPGMLFSVKKSSYSLGERAGYDFGDFIASYERVLSKPALFLTLPEDLVLLCVIAFGGIAAILFFWCEHDILRIIAVPYLGMVLFACFDAGSAVGSDHGFLTACAGVLTAALTVGMVYLMGQSVSEAEADSVRGNRNLHKQKTDEEDAEKNGTTVQENTADTSEKKKMKKAKEAKAEEKEAKAEKKKAEEKKAEKKKAEEKKAEEKKREETKAEEKKTEEKKAEEKKTEETKAEEKKTEEKKAEEKKAEEKKAEEKKEEEAKAKETKEDAGKEKEDRSKEKEDEKSKVNVQKPRFIENPLPLPKKREHREMDYAYEVSADRMHYDVEVRDGDDFDC